MTRPSGPTTGPTLPASEERLRHVRALSHLVEHTRATWWALRRHGLLLAGAAIVLLGTPIALLAVRGFEDTPNFAKRSVEDAAALLRDDFARGVEVLDPALVRTFSGANERGMSGMVARADDGGICWGFSVVVPNDWLADGTGTVSVGAVGVLDDSACVAS